MCMSDCYGKLKSTNIYGICLTVDSSTTICSWNVLMLLFEMSVM